jgi:hypothetical protein
LFTPGQGADFVPGLDGAIEQGLANEPGRAGNGNRHSSTI